MDKREAQARLLAMAVEWQETVRLHGEGPVTEKYRAELLGALKMYRAAYEVTAGTTVLGLLDTYTRSAQEFLDG
jgi:hypothetical protein